MVSALRYEGVSKAFSKEKRNPGILKELFRRSRPVKTPVLVNFSADIAVGEKLYLKGANGSGKSTLLRLAVGLCTADAGRVLVAGRDAERADRARIGVMFSNQLLYGSLSGYQNLELTARLYGCDDVPGRLAAACDRWRLNGFVHQTVDGYSSGMKAVLAMARATLHDPDLLLLDEPLTFLDQANRDLFTGFLKTCRQTVVSTGQDDGPLKACSDRMIAL